MPDISLCRNNTCPSKKYCYRYTAKPNELRQSYGSFEVKKGKDKCEFYIKTPACFGTERGNIEL